MNKYFLTPPSDNEIVLNKLSLKKIKTIAKRLGLKNYSQYNSTTKLDLINLILKEEFNAGDWFNKLNRLDIKKLKSIAERLDLKIKQNSKQTDLGPVSPTAVKVNCRLKCFVTVVTYC
jgi:hypothetical protein